MARKAERPGAGRIVDIDVAEEMQGSFLEYAYSVKWKPVTIKFSDRMDRYSRYSFLPQHLEVRRRSTAQQAQHGPSLRASLPGSAAAAAEAPRQAPARQQTPARAG